MAVFCGSTFLEVECVQRPDLAPHQKFVATNVGASLSHLTLFIYPNLTVCLVRYTDNKECIRARMEDVGFEQMFDTPEEQMIHYTCDMPATAFENLRRLGCTFQFISMEID